MSDINATDIFIGFLSVIFFPISIPYYLYKYFSKKNSRGSNYAPRGVPQDRR